MSETTDKVGVRTQPAGPERSASEPVPVQEAGRGERVGPEPVGASSEPGWV